MSLQNEDSFSLVAKSGLVLIFENESSFWRVLILQNEDSFSLVAKSGLIFASTHFAK
jgi:hypothetical protein